MEDSRVVRATWWAVQHFLASWGVASLIATTINAAFNLRSYFLAAFQLVTGAPFMFVWELARPLEPRFGERVAAVAMSGIVACIYIALDVALWAVIRSARRGAKALQRKEDCEGIRDVFDRGSFWFVRCSFLIWALVVAATTFFFWDFHGGIYQPNLWGTVFYGSMLLAAPLLPLLGLLRGAGVDMADPASRGVVMISFVVVCFLVDAAAKGRFRKSRSQE